MSVTNTGLVAFTGIESGLDTSSIISAYMAADEGPLDLLQTQQTTNDNQITAYQTIETQLEALQTAAEAASAATAFSSLVSASSSDSAVASATTGTGATTGSTTFTVDQLATANTLVSSGTVSAPTDVIASGSILLGVGTSGLGITSVAGSGLTSGSHTISVTQASAGATIVGSTPPATSTTITSANDQLAVTIDGTAQTFTLAQGNDYTPTQLAAAVATASNGVLTAEVNSDGQIQLATAEQGSDVTLQIGAGSANAALGLAVGSVVNGTDGVITVDGQANTVSDIAAAGGTSVTLTSGSGGTVTATLAAGGLSAGSVTAQSVSVGNGSLASVVSAINSANAGVTAEALEVGTNQYALEVTSDSTGSTNDVSLDPSAFSGSGLGSMATTTAGQDAVVSLGGAGGYQVDSSSNTLTGLLPGVSIALQSVSSAPVTVTVSPDGQAAASVVQSLVTAANQVLSTISTDTAYDQTTNTAGVLNGDYTLQALGQSILSTFGDAIGNSSVIDDDATGSSAGLSLDGSTGQINFDADTFATAYDNDPAAVTAMFSQGGSFAPSGSSTATASDVSLAFAGETTDPGSYDVDISQSATQATDTGTAEFASPTAAVATSEVYTVSAGGLSANYGIAAGESLSDVASGLNSAFASAGLLLSAQVVTQGTSSSLQVTSADYGSDQSLSVTSSGADELGLNGSFTGTDVAGTIDGVAATGAGQVLNSPVDDSTLDGLSLLVTTPGITSLTDLGTFSYTPGLAGSLASLATASTATDGELPTTIAGLTNNNAALSSQITLEEQLLTQQQDALTTEFDNLETTLTSLKSESSYLTSLDDDDSSTSSSLESSTTSS